MKSWMKAAAAALLLSAPAAAQSAGGVSVWLQLPRNAELAAPGRVQGANAQIIKLLGPDAASVTYSAKDGPLVHYTAASWSLEIAPEKRRENLSTLAADWGPALRVDGEAFAGAPAFLNGPSDPAAAQIPTPDSMLSLVPASLLAGNHAGFYDGYIAAPGSVEPISGRPGAVFPGLAPATRPAGLSAPKPTPPSLLSEPYSDLIQEAARASGIDPALLRAVVVAKSGLRADRASAGAYGLMGISARNAKIYGYTTQQILDPETNLTVGSDILAGLLKEFDGDVHRALAAYQVGSLAVLRSGGIPNDRDVKDFMAAVERALDPAARKASLPVKAIHRPLKDSAQTDAIELAEQIRKIPGVAQYRPLIKEAAAQVGVDAKLMEAIIMQEDASGDPDAISPKGAQGLAQLMPPTAADLGVEDPSDPVQSLNGMARYIKQLSVAFKGDPVLIAAAYNSGRGTVHRLGLINADKGTVPRLGWVPRLPETMAYVRRVFNNYFTLTGEKVDVEPYMSPKRQPHPRAHSTQKALRASAAP